MASAPTLADFKTQLSITTSSYDTALTSYLAAAQKLVENRIGPVATASFSETVNARGSGLNLSYRPIVTITSLTPLLNTWPSFATADVAWDSRAGTVWRRDLGTLAGAWTVAYTAGNAGVITDSQWLAILLVGQDLWKNRRGAGTMRPGQIPEEAVIPGAGYMFPDDVQALLDADGLYYGGIA